MSLTFTARWNVFAYLRNWHAVVFIVCFSVLVGAPRDNITDRSAPADVRILVRPGAVYKCPFSSSANDCSAIKVDRESKYKFTKKNKYYFIYLNSDQPI